jgi:hypothetical protein
MTLAKARIVNYDRNCSFILLATIIMIVNYDLHLFIVQATEVKVVPSPALMTQQTKLGRLSLIFFRPRISERINNNRSLSVL